MPLVEGKKARPKGEKAKGESRTKRSKEGKREEGGREERAERETRGEKRERGEERKEERREAGEGGEREERERRKGSRDPTHPVANCSNHTHDHRPKLATPQLHTRGRPSIEGPKPRGPAAAALKANKGRAGADKGRAEAKRRKVKGAAARKGKGA